MMAFFFGLIFLQVSSPVVSQEPTAQVGAFYFHHEASVECAAIPFNSEILVSLDSAGRLSGWDIARQRRRYSLPIIRAGASTKRLTCSRDGRFVALSSSAL